MLVAALLLLIVAVLLVVIGVLGGGDSVDLDVLVGSFQVSATVVFFLGMVTLLCFVVSLMLFRSAGRRAAARRRDRKKVSELSEKLEEFERDRRDDQRGSQEQPSA